MQKSAMHCPFNGIIGICNNNAVNFYNMCIWRLRPSHKRQCSDTDADGDRQDGTQGQETVVEGGAGGE